MAIGRDGTRMTSAAARGREGETARNLHRQAAVGARAVTHFPIAVPAPTVDVSRDGHGATMKHASGDGTEGRINGGWVEGRLVHAAGGRTDRQREQHGETTAHGGNLPVLDIVRDAVHTRAVTLTADRVPPSSIGHRSFPGRRWDEAHMCA